MTGFDSGIPLNFFIRIKHSLKHGPETANKLGPNPSELKTGQQNTKSIAQQQLNPQQSLTSTNSNIVLNQQTLTSPSVNQAALNSTNLNQEIKDSPKLNQDKKNDPVQLQQTQVGFQGAKDLPPYAGIANMSLKSWVADQGNKTFTNMESVESQLAATLEAIPGFQKSNYEGDDDLARKGKKDSKVSKNKGFILLPQLFSSEETQVPLETDLLIGLSTFKKLGSSLNENDTNAEQLFEQKSAPPVPQDIQKLATLDPSQIKYLHQLFALPEKFPECIRLFSKEKPEIDEKYVRSFLLQRMKVVQEQVFGADSAVGNLLKSFVPILNQNQYSALIPLALLYYPLPFPTICQDYDFADEWIKKKEKEEQVEDDILASCDIYYVSKTRGRFLLKFKVNKLKEFNLDIQTDKSNNGIVRDLEKAVSEIMLLLDNPPQLSELNVLLTQEIYKATDLDEELAISSTGSLRIDIVLAVYASLIVLNRLNDEPDPSGLIEMSD